MALVFVSMIYVWRGLEAVLNPGAGIFDDSRKKFKQIHHLQLTQSRNGVNNFYPKKSASQ